MVNCQKEEGGGDFFLKVKDKKEKKEKYYRNRGVK